jgi:hypothetical protein
VQAAAGTLDVERLLKSLQLQRNPRWLALLYPLPNDKERTWSHHLLEDITRMTQRDPRIQRVGWKLDPTTGDQTATERALLEGLRGPAAYAEWVLLAHGSGLIYGPHAFDSRTTGVDVVGLGVTRPAAAAANACAGVAEDEGLCERSAMVGGMAALGTQLVRRSRVTESIRDFVMEFYGTNATGPVGEAKGWVGEATEGCHLWAGEQASSNKDGLGPLSARGGGGEGRG